MEVSREGSTALSWISWWSEIRSLRTPALGSIQWQNNLMLWSYCRKVSQSACTVAYMHFDVWTHVKIKRQPMTLRIYILRAQPHCFGVYVLARVHYGLFEQRGPIRSQSRNFNLTPERDRLEIRIKETKQIGGSQIPTRSRPTSRTVWGCFSPALFHNTRISEKAAYGQRDRGERLLLRCFMIAVWRRTI